MNEANGDGRGSEHNGHPPDDDLLAPGGRDAFINRIVAEALADAEELAKDEAGSSYGRICPPLLAGPQRYRDPSIWGPNYRVLASFATETPEQIEAMQNTPLHADERYKEVARITYQRAVELRLPGTGDN